MNRNQLLRAVVAALLLLAASPAWTQAPPSPPQAAGLSEQDRQSEALNAAVNARNADITRRVAEEEALYQARLAEWSAQNAEAEAKVKAWEKAQAEWKAQLAACRAEPFSGCNPPKLTKRSKY
ncbi:hypothetical protein [Phenylobacterium sp.]|jgi:hypothetical protein|uniref:hypothetical protein n=1 Tax=Phenylobacterium sp. TaxID=1871053 RepID=UPI0037CA4F62